MRHNPGYIRHITVISNQACLIVKLTTNYLTYAPSLRVNSCSNTRHRVSWLIEECLSIHH